MAQMARMARRSSAERREETRAARTATHLHFSGERKIRGKVRLVTSAAALKRELRFTLQILTIAHEKLAAEACLGLAEKTATRLLRRFGVAKVIVLLQ